MQPTDPLDSQGRLRQADVDEVRMRVLTSLLVAHVQADHRDGVKRKPHVRHLRFFKPKITAYTLRDWNPPGDRDRHAWEKGLRLELDLGEIAPSERKAVLSLIQQRKRDGSKAPNWDIENVQRLVRAGAQDRRIIVPAKGGKLWLP